MRVARSWKESITCALRREDRKDRIALLIGIQTADLDAGF